MFQTVLFGWVLGIGRGMEELDRGAALRVPRFVGWNLRYLAPLYLLIIFGAFMYDQVVAKRGGMFTEVINDPIVGMAVGFIFLVTIFFLLIINQAVKRWTIAEQRDKEVSI